MLDGEEVNIDGQHEGTPIQKARIFLAHEVVHL